MKKNKGIARNLFVTMLSILSVKLKAEVLLFLVRHLEQSLQMYWYLSSAISICLSTSGGKVTSFLYPSILLLSDSFSCLIIIASSSKIFTLNHLLYFLFLGNVCSILFNTCSISLENILFLLVFCVKVY